MALVVFYLVISEKISLPNKCKMSNDMRTRPLSSLTNPCAL